MKKLLLLGNEALAQGAIDAGLSGAYAYPGTPSTEIMEYIQNSEEAIRRNIHRHWSSNEKTAMETALGMSYMGKRAIVSMKHVGLNVAADAFVNSAMTGANGGILVIVADDPGMHSSQNEQDSRFYGKFAMLPILEPSNQQEAYDMAEHGFKLSERFHIPVLVRIPTRLSHSRSTIVVHDPITENKMHFPDNPDQWILLPAKSRKRYKVLIEDNKEFEKQSEVSPYNMYTAGRDLSMGIIATGIAYNYLMENCPGGCKYPILKIGQYPLPVNMIKRLKKECASILVIEEGQPFIEEQIRGVLDDSYKVKGKLTGELPRTGELTPEQIAVALEVPIPAGFTRSNNIAPRPPALCPGCGHRDMYNAINDVVREKYPDARVYSDIGCYTLGYMPPIKAIHSCIDMGASITVAKGAADAGQYPSLAVIGDSTFTHSGMTGLLDAVNEKSNIVVVISDNETTAMTGGQDSQGTGKLENICEGLGVDPAHIRVVVPLPKNMDEMKNILIEEIEYNGVSVIIPRRACIQEAKRKRNKLKSLNIK